MIAESPHFASPKCLFCMAILTISALFGCTAKGPVTTLETSFDYAAWGKVALRQDKQGFSANFHWRQRGESYVVDVWGPLGQGRIQLSGDSQYMEIHRGSKLLARGLPHDVMQQHLGWVLPVAIVPAWLHGEPLLAATTLEEVEASAGGPARVIFEELSWQVDMSRFAAAVTAPGETARLTPRRIVALSGSRRMTIIVREFSFLAS